MKCYRQRGVSETVRERARFYAATLVREDARRTVLVLPPVSRRAQEAARVGTARVLVWFTIGAAAAFVGCAGCAVVLR